MEILDKMDKKLTELGRSAVEKTKEMVGSARLTGERNEVEQKIEQHYAQIGELFMQQLQAGSIPEEYRELYEHIHASQTRIEQLEEERKANEMRNGCPNCGAEVKAGQAFCIQCGQKLQEQSNAVPKL